MGRSRFIDHSWSDVISSTRTRFAQYSKLSVNCYIFLTRKFGVAQVARSSVAKPTHFPSVRMKTRHTHLGKALRTDEYDKLKKTVLEGVPASATNELAAALSISRLTLTNELDIARSVVAAKLASGALLSPALSDKLYRAERLFAKAKDVFESDEDAALWMVERHAFFAEKPLAMARTTPGFEQAMAALDKISFGLPA